MAKKISAKKTQPLAIEQNRPAIPKAVQLLPEETARLREILEDPVFVKAWNNALTAKPSVIITSPDQFKAQNAAFRLYEIRGWELFATAIIAQTHPQKSRQEQPQEFKYNPDSQ